VPAGSGGEASRRCAAGFLMIFISLNVFVGIVIKPAAAADRSTAAHIAIALVRAHRLWI
jgi:hypothetical protein